ncbi:MAG: hypothetical protein ABJB66_04575 [Gemmatimonadaceae bacterium]
MSDSPYRQLDQTQIVATLTRLRERIAERFPAASLGGVSQELLTLTNEATDTIAYLRRPLWILRIAVGTAIVGAAFVLFMASKSVRIPVGVSGVSEFFQGIEAAINDLIFFGLGVFFLVTVEMRIKRRRALKALHQLRSIIHIVDMHQLTKDPERLMSPQRDTASSPERSMTPPELGRYLDYCSELLSVTSKVAALFAQYFKDPVVLVAVNDIESLAAGYSSKIWQKITLLERVSTRLREK